MNLIYTKEQLQAFPEFERKYSWCGIPQPETKDNQINTDGIYGDINRSVWFLNKEPKRITAATWLNTTKLDTLQQLSNILRPETLAQKHLKILEILWNQFLPYFVYTVLNELFISNISVAAGRLTTHIYNEKGFLTYNDNKWTCWGEGVISFKDDSYTIPSMGYIRFINRAVFDASLLTDSMVLPTDTNYLINFVKTNLKQPNGFELDYVKLEGSPFLINAFASYLKAQNQAALDKVYGQFNQYTHAESLRIEREKTSNLNRNVYQIYTKEKLDITPKWDMKYGIALPDYDDINNPDKFNPSLYTDMCSYTNKAKFCNRKMNFRGNQENLAESAMKKILAQELSRDRCCIPLDITRNFAQRQMLVDLHLSILELTWSQILLSIMSTILGPQLMSQNCYVGNIPTAINLYYNHGNWICDVQGSIKVKTPDSAGRPIPLPHHYLDYKTTVVLDLRILQNALKDQQFQTGSDSTHFNNKANLKKYIIETLKQPNGFELYEIQILRGDFLLRKLVDTYVRTYSAAEITSIDTTAIGSLNDQYFVKKKPHIDILVSYIKANEKRGVDARSAFGFLTGGRHKTAQAKVAAATKLKSLLKNQNVTFTQVDIAALNDGQLKIYLQNMQIVIDPKVFAAISKPARKGSVITQNGKLPPT